MEKQRPSSSSVEISAGRWVPTLDPSATWNFGFLQKGGRLRKVAAGAEQLIHTQPSAALARLRLFGELLAREIAPAFGVSGAGSLDQLHLLRALQTPRGPGQAVLDRLHRLRRIGNAATHEDEGTRGLALDCLKDAHHLARWYARDVRRLPVLSAAFETPPDPREQARALLVRVQEAGETAARHSARIAELERALEAERTRSSEASSQALEASSQLEAARGDAEAAEQLAEETEQRATRLLRLERRVLSVKSALVELGLDDPDTTDLPEWAAGVAGGAAPPSSLEIPDEVIEDLQALGADLEVQQPEAPALTLKSSGRLGAGGSAFTVAVRLRTDTGTSELQRRGHLWVDESGHERLLPPELASALDELTAGPPKTETEDPAAVRRLWWARLRRRLAPFGVQPDDYLGGVDVVEVEKFKPRLVATADGQLELQVTVGNLDPASVTQAVDRIRDTRNPRSAKIRGRDANGKPVRTELLLSPVAAESVRTIRRLRRSTRDLTPQLIDAPAALLDPELFDLSEYGDRVVGFGRVVYRVQPAMQPGPGGKPTLQLRVPGTEGEDSPKTLSPELAAELAKRLEAASARNQPYLEFEGNWVRVPPSGTTARLLEPPANPPRVGSLVVADNIDVEQFAVRDTGRGVAPQAPRPPGLTSEIRLFPHQEEGLSWLSGHALLGEGSSDHGLLADDMGLGKTLQVLSLMSLLKEQEELGPCLIVAPLSLLRNWAQEAQRFFPKRFDRWIQLGGGGRNHRLTAEQVKAFDVVLTSYESLRSQQLELGRVEWKLMVLDESDRVRNPTTRTNHAVLAMTAERRLALTGTPIQNSLVDLWAQFDWLAPGLLGDLKSFRSTFVKRKQEDSTRQESAERLRALLQGRVLRRLKEEVLADELPTKTVLRHRIPMTPSQAGLYRRILGDLTGARGETLGVMHRLFQTCSAPGMLDPESSLAESHPKLRWLLQELASIAERGEKVAIFAEWYAVQDQVAAAITSRFGLPVERVNGKVSAGHRLAKIEAFNRRPGFGAIVLGPKATGVGLNITGANHVIHFTRHWNPALEAQATDRVYRIGQTRPVTAHLPIVVHPELTSIEEHLDRLLSQKTALARDFLAGFDDLDVGKELRAALSGSSAEEKE